MSDRTTLVTGGAGFIGSHLSESLLADGHRVVCLDNLGSGRLANVEGFRDEDRFVFVEGDVRGGIDAAIGDRVDPASIDRVYHLASRASPTDFESHPLEIAETNTHGTRNVLEFARSVGARVLYASTSEVYGDPTEHPQHESYFGNVDPRGERACYDESKRYGEMLTTVFGREFDVDVRTARIFNTYGPRMNPTDGRVIPNFLRQALAGDDLTVYGDGTQTRSFCYVSDQVAGLRALMDAPDAAGAVVNVGSTDEITINDLAEAVLETVETDSAVSFEPLPHETDPERRRPDITRARERLGWEPTVELSEGLARTATHFEKRESL
ncbi:MAG: NAD-dependent epimerase/dehydratase family protein [Halococcoides sp.]